MAMAQGRLIRLWDYPQKRLLTNLIGLDQDVDRIVFSPDGKRLAACTHKATGIWQIPNLGEADE